MFVKTMHAFIVFLLIFCFSMPVLARSGEERERRLLLTEAEQAWLEDHPVLKFAPDPAYPPIESIDQNGNYVGLVADYIRLIEKQLDVKFELETLTNWDEVMKKAKRKEIDLLPAASPSTQRTKFLLFTQPHTELSGVIIVRDNTKAELDINELRGLKVAVVSNYVWEDYIRNDYPDIDLDPVGDIQAGLKKVSFGMVDAMVANLATTTYYIEKLGITNLRVAGDSGYFARLAMAVPDDRPLLRSILDKAIEKITPTQKQAIFNKWIHLDKHETSYAKELTFILVIFLLVFWGVLVWNRSLRNAVKRKTEDLANSEARLSSIVNNTSAIIYLKDVDSRFLLVNKQFEELFQVSSDDVLGKTAHDFFPKEVADVHRKNDLEVLSKLTSIESEETAPLDDGLHTYISIKFCLFDKFSEPYGVCGISTDITERKKAEQELQDAKQNFSALAENSKDGFLVNLDGQHVFANKSMVRILGYDDTQQLIGTTIKDIVHPDELEKVLLRADSRLMGNDVTSQYESIFISKTGKSIPVELNATITQWEGRTAIMAIIRDITQRKLIDAELNTHRENLEELVVQRSAELKQSESKYRTLFETSDDAIMILDDTGFVDCNKATLDMFGCANHDEFIGRHPGEISPAKQPDGTESRIAADERIATAQKKGKNFFEWTHCRSSGEEFPAEVLLTPMELNGVGVFQAIVRDITKRKDVELAFIEARDHAEFANKAKSEFLARMSHELRTPMNAILGFGQLLQINSDNLHKDQKDGVDQIMSAGKHLLDLIDEVLDIVKVDAGKTDLSIEAICLDDIVNSVVVMVRPLADKNNVKILITSGTNLWVHSDMQRLKQVFLNLLSNAIKYNKPAGEVRIELLIQQSDKIRINISDTGMGIGDKDRDKVFEPFQRVSLKTQPIEGTGIGLSITKKLVEAMGGQIGFDSEEGTGSTFWIELPRSKPLTIDVSEGELADSSFPTSGDVSVSKKTILYVEDNPANQRLLEQIIGNFLSCELIIADTAETGLDIARDRSLDLILMDINLPKMDGYEALALLRKDPDTAQIPVIAMSAEAMPDQIKKGIDAGFNEYISKPFEINEIRDILDQTLNSPG